MKGAISSKGQITVPLEVRRKLGLTPGTRVRFELVPAGALLRKGAGPVHPVDAVYGRLRLPRSADDLLDEMRGQRPRKR